MSLLVEYSVNDGMAQAQIDALKVFVEGLKAIGDEGFDYTAFETDDPTKFIAVLEFDDDAAKQRFLDSSAFAEYRDGSEDRFPGPPSTTTIRLVASTRD
ncbi:MAG: antibiotic biosynthesis monooxygenase [Pseudomonadota bacterium]